MTAVFEPVEGGWTQARIAELPAVITAAPSQDEAREMLVDALSEYLLLLGRSGESIKIEGSSASEPLEITLGA